MCTILAICKGDSAEYDWPKLSHHRSGREGREKANKSFINKTIYLSF